MISLFLDLDGTLIDLAESPGKVQVPRDLHTRLKMLEKHLHGTMAIASGRNIVTLDHLLYPYVGPAIGVHGIEIREGKSTIRKLNAPPLPEKLRAAIAVTVRAFSGAVLEDKDVSIAVHYRHDAAMLLTLTEEIQSICDYVAPAWRCLTGHNVVEVRPTGIDKGTGLIEMMKAEHFAHSIPVSVGDDTTDLDMFAAANRLGGLTISVGNRIAGKGDCHLATPADVLQLLDKLIAESGNIDISKVKGLVAGISARP